MQALALRSRHDERMGNADAASPLQQRGFEMAQSAQRANRNTGKRTSAGFRGARARTATTGVTTTIDAMLANYSRTHDAITNSGLPKSVIDPVLSRLEESSFQAANDALPTMFTLKNRPGAAGSNAGTQAGKLS